MLILFTFFSITTHSAVIFKPSTSRIWTGEILIQTPQSLGLSSPGVCPSCCDTGRAAHRITQTHSHPLHAATNLQTHTGMTSFYPPIPSG